MGWGIGSFRTWIQVEMSSFLESDSVVISDLEPLPGFGVSLHCESGLSSRVIISASTESGLYSTESGLERLPVVLNCLYFSLLALLQLKIVVCPSKSIVIYSYHLTLVPISLPSSLRVPFQVELVSLRFFSLFHPYLFAIAPFLRRPFPSCSGFGIPWRRHPTSKPSLQAYRSAHLIHPRTTFLSYIYLFLRSKLPSISHLSAFYLEAVFRTLHFLPSCLKWTHINKNKSPWLPSHEAFSAHARAQQCCANRANEPNMLWHASSITKTKEMLADVGQKVWLVSNFTQHVPTSCNIAQHGVQTNATCCAQQCWAMLCQHVAFICTGLKLLWMLFLEHVRCLCNLAKSLYDIYSVIWLEGPISELFSKGLGTRGRS